MRRLLLVTFLLASCGGNDAPEGNQLDLPQPSGPPIAQQADAVPSSAPDQSGVRWESAAGGEGTALRLVAGEGRLLLSIACLAGPRRLVASAPGFKPVGSEDRFSLGLGDEPVTLVADPEGEAEGGVTGEGGIPKNFPALLEDARQVSAVYGSQQVGPHPAPPGSLKKILRESCVPK